MVLYRAPLREAICQLADAEPACLSANEVQGLGLKQTQRIQISVDFRAQSRNYLYTWIPREMVVVLTANLREVGTYVAMLLLLSQLQLLTLEVHHCKSSPFASL